MYKEFKDIFLVPNLIYKCEEMQRFPIETRIIIRMCQIRISRRYTLNAKINIFKKTYKRETTCIQPVFLRKNI